MRQVTEPKFPPTCTVLAARLVAPGGALGEASEGLADTARIQGAIDQCAAGKAVALGRGAGGKNIFLSAPLALKAGVTLLVEEGVALFASRNPRDYDITPGSCGTVGPRGRGCKAFVAVDHAPGSGIMGDGAIDGRGGAKLLGRNVTWWDLAHTAKVLDQSQSVPRLVAVSHSDNFTLYRITLRNSPNFHVGVDQTDGFTAWALKIRTPKTARNTDGIDPSSSTNVTIAYCDISTGDDDVAIKTNATVPSTHMTIVHNRFYAGHGMSIGSGTAGGVSAIRVEDLTIDGADNGIRIKSDRSRGGLVEDISYENVCIRDVPNPIVVTSMYTTFPGDRLPVYRNIRLRNVESLTPGYVTFLGVDDAHKLDVTLDNVRVDGLRAGDLQSQYAGVHAGAGGSNLVSDETPAGVPTCRARFEPQRAIPSAPAAAVAVPPEDKTLYVAASGTGDFYSIQRAIDVAPAEGAEINIAPGTYREVLHIAKPNIHLHSPYKDATRTVIVFDKSAGTSGGTMRSATVDVSGDNFSAENLTFANDFNPKNPQTPQGSQASALNVTGDRAVFRNVRFLGHQDTVYAASKNGTPSRQYFADCYIEGNVDFIFGDGKSVFERCEIRSNAHQIGYITAQGRKSATEDSGFVFDHCRLTADPEVEHVWLGRPWRPYATAIFLHSEMGAHIEPAGWREWHPGETNYLETAFYAEYDSSGPGAGAGHRDPRTKLLDAKAAAGFDPRGFLVGKDGWEPSAAR